jgi:hypothetical protein
VEYPIEPYVGVGPIRLGMTVDEVRAAVGSVAHPLRKGRKSTWDTDYFRELGYFVYYKDPGICEAVEFGDVTMPTWSGRPLLGRPLLGRPFQEVHDFLKAADPSLQVDASGLTSLVLGIGIYVESLVTDWVAETQDWEQDTEGVIVFERGYYG